MPTAEAPLFSKRKENKMPVTVVPLESIDLFFSNSSEFIAFYESLSSSWHIDCASNLIRSYELHMTSKRRNFYLIFHLMAMVGDVAENHMHLNVLKADHEGIYRVEIFYH